MSGEPPRFYARLAEASAKKPFAIGLAPIALADWIECDDEAGAQIRAKAAILADETAGAFQAVAGGEAAQRESYDLLVEHLRRRFPAQDIARPAPDEPPLLAASRLVADDLALLVRDSSGWRLVAASLCFPSTWILREKIGRLLNEVHEPVPGYAGTMAARVARVLDSARPDEPLERFNLSLYGDGRLRHAEARQDPARRFPADVAVLDTAHLRIERQTLRRLPTSGAVLFTIRIHLQPLASLADHPERAALARVLHDHFASLTGEQLAYKGVAQARERALAAFVGLGAAPRRTGTL